MDGNRLIDRAFEAIFGGARKSHSVSDVSIDKSSHPHPRLHNCSIDSPVTALDRSHSAVRNASSQQTAANSYDIVRKPVPLIQVVHEESVDEKVCVGRSRSTR